MTQPTPSPSQHLLRSRLTKALRLGAEAGKKTVFAAEKLYRKYTTRHILLYTDSRGINIPGHPGYKHYSTRLRERYYVDDYISPEKWTTIPDFIKLYRQIAHHKYDFIILHAGAVDAAPRHQKTILNTIYPQKKDILDTIFGKADIQAYYQSDLGCEYEGDKTINLYSLEMAHNKLLPLLRQIPHLIWISSNRIVPGWRGNYWKDRPENIRMIEDYSRLFADELNHQVDIIDLMEWSISDVQKLTFDNIHPNEKGSDYIYDHLLEIVDKPRG